MNTRNPIHIAAVDSHAALARAHADRAKHLGLAMAQVSGLLKRIAARLRANGLPHAGLSTR